MSTYQMGRYPGTTKTDTLTPVIHRRTVLGQARSRAGALLIAKRKLPRQFPDREHHTATLVDNLDDDGVFIGKAWAVGVALTS